MKKDLPSAINRLAERNSDRTRDDRQRQLQRRNQVVDIFGMEFTRQGDTAHPATFYLSISPDLVYYERFEFKLIIQPFAMPIGGGGATGMTTAQLDSTTLRTSIMRDPQDNKVVQAVNITPNPHDHASHPHNHSLDAGVTLFTSSVENFEVWIEGIDITPYLKAQYNGAWIDGEGIYPTEGMSNYDILKIVGTMPKWQQGVILQPGYKKVEIKAVGTFNVTLVNYLKYSHVNR